jgi:hypothetical protein
LFDKTRFAVGLWFSELQVSDRVSQSYRSLTSKFDVSLIGA